MDSNRQEPIASWATVHRRPLKYGRNSVSSHLKNISSCQLIGSIQLGITHTVAGLASKPDRDLLLKDFMMVETTNFDPWGSHQTPAHQYPNFTLRSYAPLAFRHFRDLFGIKPGDFLLSICKAPWREMANPGASGAHFYLSADDEFIMKTLKHKEGHFLKKLLLAYYMNIHQNPCTLLPKFFGHYCYQVTGKSVRMVVMNNLLPTSIEMHEKFDLKGSLHNRKASKSERKKRLPTFKDLDFLEMHPDGIMLEADTYEALIKTIRRDCLVLESFKIMDYSLLIAIHNLDTKKSESAVPLTPKRNRLVAHSTAMESIQVETAFQEDQLVPPGGIPARNSKGERLLLYLGIIDILQSYGLRKMLERALKIMVYDEDKISVNHPKPYSRRFQAFMTNKVFKVSPEPFTCIAMTEAVAHTIEKNATVIDRTTNSITLFDEQVITKCSSAQVQTDGVQNKGIECLETYEIIKPP